MIERVQAPAKLTLSLRVLGLRPDGFHELDAEMVAIDLADVLEIDPSGEGLTIVAGEGASDLEGGPSNLITRALRAVDKTAHVRLVKAIPVGGGLGGGSTDAAAILRWARCSDLAVALSLGSDVPFCLLGGRARVTGVGEVVEPLADLEKTFTLLVPPVHVDTAAVYAAWDHLDDELRGGEDPQGNDLVEATLRTAPQLEVWRETLARLSGRPPRLAGSGATWFVEGALADLGLAAGEVEVGGRVGTLIEARTTRRHGS
ncbi:MAG: 4-(cytidine 5'-diphospho)-2-C-methyl-D-erythritol kinase [Acidimicrobiales bacterium]